MCDGNRFLCICDRLQCFLNVPFGMRIQYRGYLVHENDLGVLQDRARNGDML